jgi:hypothetical protein
VDLIRLERDILRALEFDLQWVCPLVYLERCVKLVNLQHLQSEITEKFETHCKSAMVNSKLWLNERTSVIAVSILTLSLNILAKSE